jgi:hypothetical protein
MLSSAEVPGDVVSPAWSVEHVSFRSRIVQVLTISKEAV